MTNVSPASLQDSTSAQEWLRRCKTAMTVSLIASRLLLMWLLEIQVLAQCPRCPGSLRHSSVGHQADPTPQPLRSWVKGIAFPMWLQLWINLVEASLQRLVVARSVPSISWIRCTIPSNTSLPQTPQSFGVSMIWLMPQTSSMIALHGTAGISNSYTVDHKPWLNPKETSSLLDQLNGTLTYQLMSRSLMSLS